MTPGTRSGSVIWQVTMSLDGYIAAPEDEMSWVFEHIDPANPAGAEIPELKLIGTTQEGDIVTAHYRVQKEGSTS